MNAVEIEEAVSALVAEPFNGEEFPYQFLAAFGFKDTTLKKLKAGAANTTDFPGAVLLRSNIHMIVAPSGQTSARLAALKASTKTAKGKCKFVLATDGELVEAEELATGELLACRYAEIPNHFGFFLPLAGISTVAEIKDNPIDIRATGRLNKLYVQLLKDNTDWDCDAKRPALNQFMSRLIFCFFAEDTGIFLGEGLFTACLKQMSDETNTHDVIKELFRAMNTHPDNRKAANIRPYADAFPYVNGGLFSNEIDCPRFSKIARSYLLRIGELNWKEINPDIFGSMIQAVADDDERGSLGMHYTSVPNILKVLDPLFLDELREQLEEAADNPRKLLNLRKRIAAIRVFDPACGSGNFLVIAYIKLREIEAEIIRRRKDDDRRSWIKLTNFYGIEIKSFPAEIARLALLIAEFQCNVRFIGQREACLDVLPLHDTGRIVTGNALRLEWTEVCPPSQSTSILEEDLGGPTGRLSLDAEPASEVYICGNPPYSGYNKQSPEQKNDLTQVFSPFLSKWGTLDYVAAWFFKAAQYGQGNSVAFSFVATNTICQGGQVSVLWPEIFKFGWKIFFAVPSFKWGNLATKNAGITVSVVGLTQKKFAAASLYLRSDNGQFGVRQVSALNAYLVPGENLVVKPAKEPLSGLARMSFGNHPYYAAPLIMNVAEAEAIAQRNPMSRSFFRPLYGSTEVIDGLPRVCIWLKDDQVAEARRCSEIAERIDQVQKIRLEKRNDATARKLAQQPYRFRDQFEAKRHYIAVPQTTSENRRYLPCTILRNNSVVTFKCFAMYDAELMHLAIVASRMHTVWIGTICARMRTDYSYSNTLGWNTFPVPTLTENDKAALTRCAEDILLAREAHFPATIADLYDPETMPADLRAAHDRNDETLERIYIGRRFKNDTERLEKLFDMYTKMIKDEEAKGGKSGTKSGRKTKQAEGEADAL
jgi:hypothetical protein